MLLLLMLLYQSCFLRTEKYQLSYSAKQFFNFLPLKISSPVPFWNRSEFSALIPLPEARVLRGEVTLPGKGGLGSLSQCCSSRIVSQLQEISGRDFLSLCLRIPHPQLGWSSKFGVPSLPDFPSAGWGRMSGAGRAGEAGVTPGCRIWGGWSSSPPAQQPWLCPCSCVLLLQVAEDLEGDITMVTGIILENCCHYCRGRVKTNRNYQFFYF